MSDEEYQHQFFWNEDIGLELGIKESLNKIVEAVVTIFKPDYSLPLTMLTKTTKVENSEIYKWKLNG